MLLLAHYLDEPNNIDIAVLGRGDTDRLGARLQLIWKAYCAKTGTTPASFDRTKLHIMPIHPSAVTVNGKLHRLGPVIRRGTIPDDE